MAQSLCPRCGHDALRIRASAVVHYDVCVGGDGEPLSVIGEAVSEDGWDGGSTAICLRCDWSGTVGQVSALAWGHARA